MSAGAAPAVVQAILLDIEGTTTPIAFVYEVLFPYARKHLRRHIEKHAASAQYHALFDRLRDEHAAEQSSGQPAPEWVDAPLAQRLESITTYCEWLMDRDRKSTALKELQGHIWQEGYSRGELVGEVFADVPPAFARWRQQRVPIGIFSSGSVLAQELLFRHSSAGDLTPFLRWYFDTTLGAKSDAESYRRIAATMAVPADRIVFISDVTRELDAAQTVGMQTRLSIRPGNKLTPDHHGHTVVRTFEGVIDRV